MSIKDHVSWALLHQALIIYWCIWDLCGPANLVALTIAKLDDTLPRFADDRRDSVCATHGLPIEVFAWKMALGRGRTQSRLFDSHHERWPLVVPSWLKCVVLPGYFPCNVSNDSNLRDTLGYGWSLLAASKDRSWNVNMVDTRLTDDVDYFVVMACYLINYYWSYLCILSIGCQSNLANQLNLANNLLKSD
jgi:hypothetical protein